MSKLTSFDAKELLKHKEKRAVIVIAYDSQGIEVVCAGKGHSNEMQAIEEATKICSHLGLKGVQDNQVVVKQKSLFD